MKRMALTALLGAAVGALVTSTLPGADASRRALGAGTITIDLAAPRAAIPSTLYGIFYEEINHAGMRGTPGPPAAPDARETPGR